MILSWIRDLGAKTGAGGRAIAATAAGLLCAGSAAGPAAAITDSAFDLDAVGLSIPHLFAAASGAVAVAALLAAVALYRRDRAARRALAGLQSRLDNDLSQERVFAIVDGRLEPASAGAETYVRNRFAQFPEAAGPETAPARAGALLSDETHRAVAARLRALAADGAPFEADGRDHAGRPIRLIGRVMGAKAVVRLWPSQVVPPSEPVAAAAKPTEPPAPPRPTPQPGAEPAPASAQLPASADGPEVEALRLAFDRAPSGVAVCGGDGRLLTANAAFARLFRLDQAWLDEGPTLRAVLNVARTHGRVPERAKVSEWLVEVAADPVGQLGPETLWSLGDGDTLRVAPHALPSGGAMLLVSDETDALSLERRYKAAVGARLAALNAVDQGLALVGLDGRALVINPAFGRIWGLDVGDPRRGAPNLEGAPIAALAEIAGRDPADAAAWRRILSALQDRVGRERGRRGAGRQAESFSHARANGRILSIQVSPQPDGGALIACADVTDARRAEQTLAEKASALEAADRLKSEFLNTVAGQLRTPLDTVITIAETLRDGSAGPLRKRQREHLQDVLKAANDLREVVSDALALGALKGGAAAEIDAGPLDLRRTCAHLATSMAARARRRGAELTTALPPEPIATHGDEPRLKQAIAGALAAAMSGAGQGDRMALRLTRSDGRDGPQAEIEITLRRGGVDQIASVAETVRSPFASEAAAVAVSLARRIVEAHGGRLEVSADAERALAAFRLPLIDAAQPADPDDAP